MTGGGGGGWERGGAENGSTPAGSRSVFVIRRPGIATGADRSRHNASLRPARAAGRTERARLPKPRPTVTADHTNTGQTYRHRIILAGLT